VLTLRLLGTASIQGADGGAMAGRAAQGPRMALLAWLAMARGRPVSRDKLIALLWPDARPERARPQLSDTLYILRTGLGEDAVRSVDDSLTLGDVVSCDVTEFEALLDAGALERAVETYAGPLLDGFHLVDSPAFEDWLAAERGRLALRYGEALEALAAKCEGAGDFAGASAWWRRLATHDPHNGHVALRLMHALDAAGDRVGALQHARIHATLLREDFDAEPDADVLAFAERLRIGPQVRVATEPRVHPATGPREVVGRAPAGAPAGSHTEAAAPSTRDRSGWRRWGAAAVTLAVLAGALAYAMRPSPGGATAAPARSVAILPFVDMSADSTDRYFSDGLTEQVITALSGVAELRVAARTSSFALRDRGMDARAIGQELGVETVLEGSVRKAGDRLRVTAQLIDARTGYHIWSQQFDEELLDVFAVQDGIAQAIAKSLELGFSPQDRVTPGIEAYDLYLRGLYLRNTIAGEGLRNAVDLFDRAIAMEPSFALAWAGKASVIGPLLYFRHVPVEDGVAELRRATTRALELDPRLGEAHAALGMLRLFFEWDWKGAEQALRRAVELNPNDPHAWHHLANYNRATGHVAEAIAARTRSLELDPLNPRTHITLGKDYSVAGNDSAALRHYRRASQLDALNPLGLGLGPSLPIGPAEIFLRRGRESEGVTEYLRIAALRGATPAELESLRAGHASAGMTGFWRAWLEMDLRQSGPSPDPLRVAATWATIGDTVKTFEWLDRAWAERNPGLIYLGSDPSFRSVRTHPRLLRVLREMGLER
jgi:TolB-like protein/DNA-binding SARP family transcriptional activator